MNSFQYIELENRYGAHNYKPHDVLLCSGAEAVETAIKTVRKWGYTVEGIPADKAEIIVCENNFYGRTISIISFSTNPNSRKGIALQRNPQAYHSFGTIIGH